MVSSICAVVLIYIFVSIVYSGTELTDAAVKEYATKYDKQSSELDIKEQLLAKRETDIQHILRETKQSYPWTAKQVSDHN